VSAAHGQIKIALLQWNKKPGPSAGRATAFDCNGHSLPHPGEIAEEIVLTLEWTGLAPHVKDFWLFDLRSRVRKLLLQQLRLGRRQSELDDGPSTYAGRAMSFKVEDTMGIIHEAKSAPAWVFRARRIQHPGLALPPRPRVAGSL